VRRQDDEEKQQRQMHGQRDHHCDSQDAVAAVSASPPGAWIGWWCAQGRGRAGRHGQSCAVVPEEGLAGGLCAGCRAATAGALMRGGIIVDRPTLSSGHAFHFVSGGRLPGQGEQAGEQALQTIEKPPRTRALDDTRA
jgi:hypothetical protein